MQVVLLQRVKKLGEEHDVVNVKPGYARNFLFPQGLAAPATHEHVAKAEATKADRAAKAEAKVEGAKEAAGAISKTTLTFTKKARTDAPDAKLYGSVTEKDIVAGLKAEGIEVEEKAVKMDHIKQVGEHEVNVHLSDGIDTIIKVTVEAEKK